jgi:hypothetical protein
MKALDGLKIDLFRWQRRLSYPTMVRFLPLIRISSNFFKISSHSFEVFFTFNVDLYVDMTSSNRYSELGWVLQESYIYIQLFFNSLN